MRCTKCHYLSFEPEPRCRNCGHDLSLEDNPEEFAASAEGVSNYTATAVLAPPRTQTTSVRTASAKATTGSSRIPTADLPLFVQSMQSVSDHLAEEDPQDIEPLVKVPARPRTPMSVRRATPDPARLRAKYGMSSESEPDLWSNLPPDPIDQVALHDEPEEFQDLPLTPASGPMDQWTNGPMEQATNGRMDEWNEPSPGHGRQSLGEGGWASEPTPVRLPVGWQQPVGAAARLGAAVIDASLLAGISAGVIYLTLQVTGLSLGQIGLLPILPLSGLLVMMVVGYLLMFTVASGQTVGKMAMNLRVVGTSPEAIINDRVTVSQAAVRSMAALPSVLVLGLGFIPGLVGAGLALHDRLAHTRVIRL